MQSGRQRQGKKKLVLLRSERDFYLLIEQRLKDAGFEVMDIFDRTSRKNAEQVSYLNGTLPI